MQSAQHTSFSIPPDHQRSADTHHSNCFTGQHLVSIHDDVISDIGQNVNDCDKRHRDSNGQGQIPATDNTRNFNFLSHLHSETHFL